MRQRTALLLFVLLLSSLLLMAPISAQSNAYAPPVNGTSVVYSALQGVMPGQETADNMDSEIFLEDLDTNRRTTLTDNAAVDADPEFSENGQVILFHSSRDYPDDPTKTDLYIMDITGQDVTRLTTTGNNSNASFSQDGSQIVFASTRNGNSEIFVMPNTPGAEATQMTDNASSGADDSMPAFAPNGNLIVFQRIENGSTEGHIYVVVAADPPPNRRVLPFATTGNNRNPVFSPDANHIVFDSERNGEQRTIYTLPVGDPGNQTPLRAADDNPAYQPVFSVDGAEILFMRQSASAIDIRAMSASGQNASQIGFETRIEYADWYNPHRSGVYSVEELISRIEAGNQNAEQRIIIGLMGDLTPSAAHNADGRFGGANAFPLITSPVTIFGNGYTITGGGEAFRFFYVDGVGDNQGSLTLHDITLTGANSPERGSAVLVNTDSEGRASLVIEGSTITANQSRNGGAIYLGGTNSGTIEATITNSTISNNQANGAQGGAVYADARNAGNITVTITDSTFTGNTAREGGAIYSNAVGSGTAVITATGSTFTGNEGDRQCFNNVDLSTFNMDSTNTASDDTCGASTVGG